MVDAPDHDAPIVQALPEVSSDNFMRLTEEEKELAMELKALVEATPEVEAVSDFMYAQIAIVALLNSNDDPPNLECLLDQVRGLQCVREEHGILDTYQDACKMVHKKLYDLLPGLVLSYSYNEQNGYLFAVDITKFNRAVLSDGEKASAWLAGLYYMYHATCPTFPDIRGALKILVECEGYHWRSQDMFCVNALRKTSDLVMSYPISFSSAKYFHTGMMVNLMTSASRRLLPSRVHRGFEVGCQFEGRLDQILLVPSLEAANQRTEASFKAALKKRYNNESSFSLETVTLLTREPSQSSEEEDDEPVLEGAL